MESTKNLATVARALREVVRCVTQRGISRMTAKKGLLVLALLVGCLFCNPGRIAHMQVTGSAVRFAVIGDFGQAGQPEQDVANLVKSWNPDLIITVGDNNYPVGSAATIDQNIGQYYHDFIYPYMGAYGAGATANRFFPSLGNHDWGESGFNPGGANAYLNYFVLPANERYYDFVKGPVHFFALDSDTNEADGNTGTSVQALWLQSRLATATEPWKIVYFHHPPYSSSIDQGTSLRWPFKAWGATVVINGHAHQYERLVIDGFPYFVDGTGGNPNFQSFTAPVTGTRVQYKDDFGAMLVDASQTSITFKFINRSGFVIDTYTLPVPSSPAVSCTLPSSGLIDKWQAEGNTNDLLGINRGTLRYTASYGGGISGQAFSFDGGLAAVSLPQSGLLYAFQEMTIDGWVYPLTYGHDAFSGTYGLTVFSNTDGDGFALRVFNGYLQADVRLANQLVLQTFTQAQVPLNTWSHVALTYDGAQVKAYLNGQMIGSVPATGTLRITNNAGVCAMIGNEPSGCNIQNSGYGWNGRIDELEIFNRALDLAEIQTIHNIGAGACAPTPTPSPSPPVCVSPPAGMIAWFAGENNADDWIAGDNGCLCNNTECGPGKIGQAFNFDGLGNAVKIPPPLCNYPQVCGTPPINDALHTAFTALTVDAWVLPLNHGGVRNLGLTIISNTETDGFALRANNGYLQADLRLTNGDLLWTFNQTPLQLNVWSHVAMTYDGALVSAYINGQLVGTVLAVGSVRNTQNASLCTMIGNEPAGICNVEYNGVGSTGGWSWNGSIDEVHVYNRALTRAGIQSLYNAGSAGTCRPVPTPTPTPTPSPMPSPICPNITFGLLDWYLAEDNANDAFGVNNGTLQNGVAFMTGKINRAFSFNGATTAVSLPVTALHNAFSTLTIDAWVNPSTYGHDSSGSYGRTIFSNTDNDGFALRLRDGYLQADVRMTTGNLAWMFTQQQVPLNTWSHVAMTSDGLVVRAYINGQLVGSVVAMGSIRALQNAITCSLIGNEPAGCSVQAGAFGWTGGIDEVHIYSRALSPGEIQSIYNNAGGLCSPNPTPTPTPTRTPTPTPTPTPPAGTSAVFVKSDTSTQGGWKGLYGLNGYGIANDSTKYPAYAVVNMSGVSSYSWAASTTAFRALQKSAASDRIASTWFSSAPFSIDINLTDHLSHQVALYFLDWDYGGRAETINVVDAGTGALLDSRSVSTFSGGTYLVWTISGHVKIIVSKTSGYNAVVSGLFF